MSVKTSFKKYTLDFKFDAGTSRGVLKTKNTYFIKVWDTESPEIVGIGECGPLKGLSVDDREDIVSCIEKALLHMETLPQNVEEAYSLADQLAGKDLPALRFALEVAFLDLIKGGKRCVFDNPFYQNEASIPINGLIWMGEVDFMKQQIDKKIEEGYSCIKMKIGAIDFDKEKEVLSYIRSKGDKLILRVDANGGFSADEALRRLEQLSEYNIHSIEQPIMKGQWEEMSKLCAQSPIPIALDEELIGWYTREEKKDLIQAINPQYLILKPTLLGGFKSCNEWIEIAEKHKIGWWLTSALESNVGLNAISQYAAEISAPGYQGLGTGQLYHNNISSPLEIENGYMIYKQEKSWDYRNID
ncbi:o-succinylbenzoate synthase [Fulvivirga ligni]|uniref:o-succinylbenzoate synthase n=1 Tax=Fulvivirga ligni TaxID=2904246 RepID=UPI001F43908D|nr:o-succinylbenzoate synthase [Fulvivirga ligni]UII23944.1 o-succinylbenzoate synthase [Fulvivirga ligni]